ncbi:hypothetical protein ACWDLG_41060 [Nonomuraea sp. NPDC003727]
MTVHFGMILTKMLGTLVSGADDLGFGQGLPDRFYWVSVPMYWLWGVAFGMAAISYARRTRPHRRRCDR